MTTLLLMFAMMALFSGGSLVDAWRAAVNGYEDDFGFHPGVPFRAMRLSTALSVAAGGAGVHTDRPPTIC